MANAFRVSVRIDHPVDEVWNELTDWSQAHEFFGDPAKVVRVISKDPAKPVLEIQLHDGGRQIVTVDQFQEPSSLDYTLHEGPIGVTYQWRLEQFDGETEVDLTVDAVLRGPVAFFGPLYRRLVLRGQRGLPDVLAQRFTR